ncbi:MAG: N-acetylmuramoyl-L-alanine amidase [Negativicutes bacterium]|nr:N-acetylmuramoyl-L-alanine amidase [Negativicutes bacterium]
MSRSNIIETGLAFGEILERHVTELLIVHHVGGTDRDVSAAEIHEWHLANGWSGIGYHFVIRKNGTIERGRPENAVGSHTKGSNSRSLGINVVGDFTACEPSPAQIASLVNLCADLCEAYELAPAAIIGHRDAPDSQTECPGDNLYCLLPDIRAKVAQILNGK